MARKKNKPEPQPTRSKDVKAGPCPRNKSHRQTAVYKTAGKTRYCKCNDCGETWKIVADQADNAPAIADADATFLRELAAGLESAPQAVAQDGDKEITIIQIDAEQAAQAAKQLQRIAG